MTFRDNLLQLITAFSGEQKVYFDRPDTKNQVLHDHQTWIFRKNRSKVTILRKSVTWVRITWKLHFHNPRESCCEVGPATFVWGMCVQLDHTCAWVPFLVGFAIGVSNAQQGRFNAFLCDDWTLNSWPFYVIAAQRSPTTRRQTNSGCYHRCLKEAHQGA